MANDKALDDLNDVIDYCNHVMQSISTTDGSYWASILVSAIELKANITSELPPPAPLHIINTGAGYQS